MSTRSLYFLLGLTNLALVMVCLYYLDFNDLSWATNRGAYIGLVSALFGLTAMWMSYQSTRVKKGE
jgi:uncharacterized membrane protein YhaH (DUF805 family)